MKQKFTQKSILLALLCLTSYKTVTAQTAFSCDGTGYIFNASTSVRGDGTASQVIYPVTIVAGESVIGTSLYTSDLEAVATAYNTSDNFIYGISQETGNTGPFHLIQYGSTSAADLGTITGLPTITGIQAPAGEINIPYNLAFYDGTNNIFWTGAWGKFSNTTAGVANANRVLYPLTISGGVATVGSPLTITGSIVNDELITDIADITFVNGFGYALSKNATDGTNTLHKINLTTGVSTVVQTYGAGQPGGTALQSGNSRFNSSFLDNLGRLSFYQGSSSGTPAGRVVRVNPFTGAYIDDTPNLSSSTNADGASCQQISTLPITLISFTATKKEKTVLLNWVTATEINNKGFYIQHSIDGVNWGNIIFVPSKNNNSSSPINYSFTHLSPSQRVNYYRLNQVDIDGKSKLSNLVSVRFIATSEFSFYPNPATDAITLQGLTVGNTIKITNPIGQVIVKKIATNESETVNISYLQSGMYFLIINNSKNTLKVMKL